MRLLAPLFAIGLQACTGSGDLVTGNGSGLTPTRFESSIGQVQLSSVGASQTVSVIARDANGAPISGVPVSWTSSDITVADVAGNDTTAVVTARAPGQATIRARAGALMLDIDVSVAVIRAITMTPTVASVIAGGQLRMVATVDADAGALTDLRWHTDNPAIAAVDEQGMVTGVAPGNTVVRASAVGDSRVSTSAQLTVTSAGTITLSPTTLALATGEQRPLSAVVQLEPGLSTALTWRTANSGVATVSASGVVTGITVGSTLVTAVSLADTTRRDSVAVVIVPVVRDIDVTPSAASISTGETRQLSVNFSADAGVSQGLIWRSSNTAVAAVSSSGLVSGLNSGTAIITAVSVADTAVRASSSITVAPRIRSVSVTPKSASLVVGAMLQLSPSVSADLGISTAVSYRSTNGSVATVSAGGMVTALAAGTARVIVASIADTLQRDTATVTVSAGTTTAWSASRLGGALFEDVVSLHAVSATSAFAINLIGDVYRWNGTAWALSVRGSTHNTQFLDVHGGSTNSVMAVGTNGVIVRFDGSSWTPVRSGTSNQLNGVYFESASSGFAVGTNGTVLRWDGNAWGATASGSTQSLAAVWAMGGIAFAVGANGEVLRYNGLQWARQTTSSTEPLLGVSGTTASNVIAVGRFGTVLTFNGASWSEVTNTLASGDLYDVQSANGAYYVAGDDGLLQVSGSRLSRVNTPYTPRLFSVSSVSGGTIYVGGQRGSVQRLASNVWTTVSLAPDLIDAWTTAANNAWAVGEFGFIYRWDGSTWSRQSAPTTATLNAVWGASADDAFAAGVNGTMLRFNSGTWTAMSFPSTSSVYGLWGSSSTNVFAVTAAGEVVRWNGSVWNVVATAGSALWAVHGSSANDIFVTGENGVALHFNGSSWNSVTASTTGTLAGVWSSGSGALTVGVSASGSGSIAFSFGSGAWSQTSTGSSRALTSVWGPNAADLYATGEQGTLLHFNGTSWAVMNSGTTDLLWSVTGAPSGLGGTFAVGYNSTVVAGSNGSSFIASMARTARTASAVSLNPAAGARLVRGALPSGRARRNHRKH